MAWLSLVDRMLKTKAKKGPLAGPECEFYGKPLPQRYDDPEASALARVCGEGCVPLYFEEAKKHEGGETPWQLQVMHECLCILLRRF